MTATTTTASEPTSLSSATSLSSGSVTAWAIRRALLGLLILTVTIGGSAWLLHASIEPSAELHDLAKAGQKG